MGGLRNMVASAAVVAVTLGAAAIRKNAAIANVKIESVRFILRRDLKPCLVDCIRNYSARFAGNHLVKF